MCEKNKIDPQIRSKHLNRYVWMNLAYERSTNAMNQWISDPVNTRADKWVKRHRLSTIEWAYGWITFSGGAVDEVLLREGRQRARLSEVLTLQGTRGGESPARPALPLHHYHHHHHPPPKMILCSWQDAKLQLLTKWVTAYHNHHRHHQHRLHHHHRRRHV